MSGWVGFDFDGVLVQFPDARSFALTGRNYGADNEAPLSFLRMLKQAGVEVRIFSALAGDDGSRAIVQRWLDEHELSGVAITDKKDFEMVAMLDDLAITIDPADGQPVTHVDAMNAILGRVGVQVKERPMPDKPHVPETKVKAKDDEEEAKKPELPPGVPIIPAKVHRVVGPDGSVSVIITPHPIGVTGEVPK